MQVKCPGGSFLGACDVEPLRNGGCVTGGPSGAETQTSTRSVAAIAAMGRDDHSDSGYYTDDSDEAVADTKELQSRRLVRVLSLLYPSVA
jgi:hypothetical protein